MLGLVYIVEHHVKSQPQRTINVEMRAKTVWQMKICHFLPIFLPFKSMTGKVAKKEFFQTLSFYFFTKKLPQLVNSRTKPLPSNSEHHQN
jgi:hypothetical protein